MKGKRRNATTTKTTNFAKRDASEIADRKSISEIYLERLIDKANEKRTDTRRDPMTVGRRAEYYATSKDMGLRR